MKCQCQTFILVIIIMFGFVGVFYVGILFFAPIVVKCLEIECIKGNLCPKPSYCCPKGCCTQKGLNITKDDPSLMPANNESTLLLNTSTTTIEQQQRDKLLSDIKKDEDSIFESSWWRILFLAGFLVGLCVCCAWRMCFRSRHISCMFACCVRRPTSNHDSAGSCYPPPHYSRCGSFHQAPPPYSEVTSKPDLYPLVIRYGGGDNKGGGNFLMVHYFRNYLYRAPGSISATSTAESLNSSFLCNAANEANSIIPPPYSCASNYEEWRGVGCGGTLLRSLSSLTEPRSPHVPPRSRTAPPDPAVTTSSALRNSADMSPDDVFRETLITSPVQPMDSPFDLELELIDYDLCCDTGCKPQLGPSPPTHRPPSNFDEPNVYEHEIDRLRHLYSCPCPSPDTIACESPPQPTSPTQSRESTLRRPSDERRHKRPESGIKKTLMTRKTSLYMPLSSAFPVRPSRISPGARASSRSAPVTPCGGLVPNLLALSQRVSASRHSSKSSRLEEENNPLLSDNDKNHDDHKF